MEPGHRHGGGPQTEGHANTESTHLPMLGQTTETDIATDLLVPTPTFGELPLSHVGLGAALRR